jgi:uncharacterized protein (TIGR01777 family)
VRIVISGASGLLGSALVPTLSADGHEVVRLVRRNPTGSDEVTWDPSAGRLDPRALAGVDAVVNLSGANLDRWWTSRAKREIVASRVDTTGLLARTLSELDPTPSVFVVSGGTGIYGDRGDEILTETSSLGSGFLAEVGKAWQDAAEPARAAGVRTVTFRQGILLSRNGGALKRMLTPFKLGVGGRVGDGRQWWSWISLDDAVAGYRRALEGTIDGPVNLTSPNPATSAQFTRTLGRVLKRPTIFPLPGIAVKTLFGERGEAVLLEGQRVLPARLLDDGFSFAYPDLDSALAHALER